MHNSQVRPQPESSAQHLNQKRLGGHLIEAGLLTPAQVDVALNDQRATGMRFGEVLVARGWIKRQTIEYLMKKVILPEQEALRLAEQAVPRRTKSGQLLSSSKQAAPDLDSLGSDRPSAPRRDLPIAKPLPPRGDGSAVSWVG